MVVTGSNNPDQLGSARTGCPEIECCFSTYNYRVWERERKAVHMRTEIFK